MIIRRKRRRACSLPVTIGFIHGTVNNISESGFLALMEGYIKSGVSHFISIQFPNNLITFKGRVSRFERVDKKGFRPTGFVFEDLKEGSFEKKKLMEFIGSNES